MIDGLKPYPEYKGSGLAWLGRIPIGWKEKRSKFLFREVDERSVSGIETRLSMSQRYGLIPSASVEEKRLVSQTNVGGKLCASGDLVLNRLKAHLGVFALSPQNGIVSPDYSVFRPLTGVNASYFCALYRSPYCGQELRRMAKGIVEGFWRLYTDEFYNVRVPLPPPDEQDGIVRFLAHANRKIDNFIRAKRKLIALLNEQKQAIIHRAVTRGLNPNAPLKPSGIPWLGDIPKHWESRKLGSLFLRRGSGTTPSGDTYYGGGVPWVMSGDLNDSVVISTKRTVTQAALFQFSALKLYPKGSLLVAMYGATIGKTGILGVGACSNQACCALAFPRPGADPVFLQACVILARHHLLQLAYGGGQPNINADVVRSLRVPLPPILEQRQIMSFLSDAITPLNTAITRTEREIALIQEYRTRLTADVVTGKLDVRPAAAKLPDLPADSIVEPVAEDSTEDVETEEAQP